MPEELWVEVRDIVQEAGIKTIPKKKKCKKAKCLSEEALQIAEKRREVKGKGEKERYTHLNAEFQRIARRDKIALLSGQCKEIEANNMMGKTRDLFKKIRDTKGIYHARDLGSWGHRVTLVPKTTFLPLQKMFQCPYFFFDVAYIHNSADEKEEEMSWKVRGHQSVGGRWMYVGGLPPSEGKGGPFH